MRRIGFLVVAVAIGFALQASPAQADGLYVDGWGDNCWSSTNDTDSDGLDDTCEYRLAYWFEPYMWFDAGESGAARRPYYTVKNYSFSSRKIQIFYMFTFLDDTGIVTGHDGDPEFNVLEVHYSAGRWYVDWDYMSQHRLSICDSSRWYYYSSLEYGTYRAWPTIYVAEDKHATYNSLAACDDGCGYQDYCTRTSSSFVGTTTGRNVGHSWDMLINAVYLNGVYEYLWNEADFAGWGDDWARANSKGYRRHLNDFYF